MTLHDDIYSLPLDSRSDLIKWLNPYLPTCITLYRRLQFGHFTSASCILSSLRPQDLQEKTATPWIVAFVDRTSRPETEVWIAASWEHESSSNVGSWMPHAEILVKALVRQIENLDMSHGDLTTVANPTEPGNVGQTTVGSKAVNRDQYRGHMANTNIVLFGAVHDLTVKILKDLNLLAPGFVGGDIPYQKYIFSLDKTSTLVRSLPRDFVYGKVNPQDYWLIKSRTQIPRQDSTLSKLPSLAIYPCHDLSTTPAPIAWAFLGPDASLSSLHVEPEYRGLGLAKSLGAKLFAEEMKTYSQHDPANAEGDERYVRKLYGHADVATDNDASQGVCKSLKGKWHFLVYWVRVDVSKA